MHELLRMPQNAAHSSDVTYRIKETLVKM